jgi:PAS domain-containing protein
MSPNWSEMPQLICRDFIPDTEGPSRTWLHKYVLPEDRLQVMATINQAIATKSLFEIEHRVLRTDTSLAWTDSHAVPILNADGEIVEWFGTAQDVIIHKESGGGAEEGPG